jgi:hypothetical protein
MRVPASCPACPACPEPVEGPACLGTINVWPHWLSCWPRDNSGRFCERLPDGRRAVTPAVTAARFDGPSACARSVQRRRILRGHGVNRRRAVRPIEKKPFFHAYPGALAYSLGCSARLRAATARTGHAAALRDPSAVAAAPHDT